MSAVFLSVCAIMCAFGFLMSLRPLQLIEFIVITPILFFWGGCLCGVECDDCVN